MTHALNSGRLRDPDRAIALAVVPCISPSCILHARAYVLRPNKRRAPGAGGARLSCTVLHDSLCYKPNRGEVGTWSHIL